MFWLIRAHNDLCAPGLWRIGYTRTPASPSNTVDVADFSVATTAKIGNDTANPLAFLLDDIYPPPYGVAFYQAHNLPATPVILTARGLILVVMLG